MDKKPMVTVMIINGIAMIQSVLNCHNGKNNLHPYIASNAITTKIGGGIFKNTMTYPL